MDLIGFANHQHDYQVGIKNFNYLGVHDETWKPLSYMMLFTTVGLGNITMRC